jgi:hypothetical protein
MSEVNTGGSDAASTDTSVDSGVTTESQESGDATPKEAAKAIQAIKERFKYKIDGEDIEEEIDLNDKESLRQRLQKGYAADKRMSEARAAKQKALDIVKQFEEDPANVFKRLGPKGREAAEKFLLEQIQDDMLSPEEKDMRMTKAELAKYQAKEAKAKEDAEKSEMSVREKKYADDFQATIIGALEKAGLPKKPELVKRMAKLLSDNLANGLELTADDLAGLVKSDKTSEIKALIQGLDGDQLIALFGEDIANSIRKSDLRRLREKQSSVFQERTPLGATPQVKKPSGPMSMDQWKASIEENLKK